MSTPQFTSRAAHREAVRSAPLTLRAVQTIRMEVELDLVAWFVGFGQADRDAYINMDLDGYEHWEKPIVHLSRVMGEAEVREPMLGEDSAVTRVDVDYCDERVSHVEGEPVVGSASCWGPDHFEALVAQVEWMRDDAVEPDPWAPGPNDIPLFDVV